MLTMISYPYEAVQISINSEEISRNTFYGLFGLRVHLDTSV